MTCGQTLEQTVSMGCLPIEILLVCSNEKNHDIKVDIASSEVGFDELSIHNDVGYSCLVMFSSVCRFRF